MRGGPKVTVAARASWLVAATLAACASAPPPPPAPPIQLLLPYLAVHSRAAHGDAYVNQGWIDMPLLSRIVG